MFVIHIHFEVEYYGRFILPLLIHVVKGCEPHIYQVIQFIVCSELDVVKYEDDKNEKSSKQRQSRGLFDD